MRFKVLLRSSMKNKAEWWRSSCPQLVFFSFPSRCFLTFFPSVFIRSTSLTSQNLSESQVLRSFSTKIVLFLSRLPNPRCFSYSFPFFLETEIHCCPQTNFTASFTCIRSEMTVMLPRFSLEFRPYCNGLALSSRISFCRNRPKMLSCLNFLSRFQPGFSMS